MAFRLPLRSLSRGILARRFAPVSTVNRGTFATLAEVILCYFLIVCFKLFLAVGSFGVDNNNGNIMPQAWNVECWDAALKLHHWRSRKIYNP